MNLKSVRTIEINATSKGVTEVTSDLDKLGKSYKVVETGAGTTAVVTERASKSALSAADAYRRQTLAVVEGARAQEVYARQLRVAEQYLKQGGITAQEHAQRVTLLQQKYAQAGDAAGKFSAANDNVRGSLSGMSEGLGSVNRLLGVFGVAISSAAVIGFAKDVFNLAASLDELAQQAGVSTEGLQAYRAAMLQSGIDYQDTDRILQRLTRTIGEANEASGKQREAFHDLGIRARDLVGGAEGALPKIAEALLKIEDASERARLETDLFGKSGQKLESALVALQKPAAEVIAQQKDLGQVMGKDVTKAADDAADRLVTRWTEIKVGMAPIITSLINGFLDLSEAAAKAVGNMPTKSGLPISIEKAFPKYAADYAMRKASDAATVDVLDNPYGGGFIQLRPKPQPAPAPKADWAPKPSDVANARALEKSAEKFISYRRELLPMDKEIAAATEKASAASTRQLENSIELGSRGQQYLGTLEEDVKLAGMSREQREIELAVMDGIRTSGGTINRQQIEGLVRARQETEQWREVVTPLGEMPGDFIADPAIAAEIAKALMEIIK